MTAQLAQAIDAFFFDLETEPVVFGRGHSAVLRDGTYCEGGYHDHTEEGIWFWNGGPLSDFEPFLLPMAELDLGQFYAVTPRSRQARRLRWDRSAQQWHLDGDLVPISSIEQPGQSIRLFAWIDPTDPALADHLEPEEPEEFERPDEGTTGRWSRWWHRLKRP